jgi:glycogen operon protein
MINSYWEELEFHIQEGTAQEWKRIVDTGLPSPDDFSDDGLPMKQAKYLVAPRSIVILLRDRKSDTRTAPTARHEFAQQESAPPESSGRKQGNGSERESGV